MPTTPYGGQNFEVRLTTNVATKLVASALFGNLYVKDKDRQVEITYPLVAVGAGMAVGFTVLTSTTFSNAKLWFPRRYWDGATVDIFSTGGIIIIGSNQVKLSFTLPDRQRISMETKGTDHYGVNADVSMNYGTQQIGILGPKTNEAPY